MRKRVRLKKPDYGAGIANLACSVLAHYGVTPPTATLPAADALLQRRWRNVVVLLLDGMGVGILQKHLSPDGFFRRHLCMEFVKGVFTKKYKADALTDMKQGANTPPAAAQKLQQEAFIYYPNRQERRATTPSPR